MPQIYAGQGRTIISNSGAVTATSATGNLKDSTAYGGSIAICEAVTLWLNVTANTGTGGTNYSWVELQTSPDGGTTWLPAARFTQVTTSTATHCLNLRTNGIGANEAAAQTSGIQTQTAAVTQNVVLSRDQRITWTISTGQSLTFGVYAIEQPAGSRGSY